MKLYIRLEFTLGHSSGTPQSTCKLECGEENNLLSRFVSFHYASRGRVNLTLTYTGSNKLCIPTNKCLGSVKARTVMDRGRLAREPAVWVRTRQCISLLNYDQTKYSMSIYVSSSVPFPPSDLHPALRPLKNPYSYAIWGYLCTMKEDW